ncbi:hypothetical protein DFH94DRAFT_842038 [Russula ochroleuca]|uniref:Uncharacterized protein n=1 Tax=Russula ochroleuca TaxID=152965 RepID=A0A9P5N4M3_9AGAM|nr:hypothetical protein DFH94DRAFT_842038 [Russula ochroleuca]
MPLCDGQYGPRDRDIPEPTGTVKKRRKKTRQNAVQLETTLTLSSHSCGTRAARKMLASGSADRTVKLWYLSRYRKDTAFREVAQRQGTGHALTPAELLSRWMWRKAGSSVKSS